MFDWNDDELADIVWDETNQNDDHIVPYPKGCEDKTLYTYADLSRKQTCQEVSTVVKSDEQKTSVTKNDILDAKLENNSCLNTNKEISTPRLDVDSWPADGSCQDSVGNKVSNEFTEVANLDIAKGQLHSDPALFGNDYEDRESDRFLEYSWDNIGNFDDLDRIFRNGDSILGNEMLGHADELWSSSADVIASPTQSYAVVASSPSTDIKGFTSKIDRFEVKTDFAPLETQPLVPDYDRMNEASGLKNRCLEEKTEDSTETTAETKAPHSLLANDSKMHRHLGCKVNRERKPLKSRKKSDEKRKSKLLQNVFGAQSPSTDQIQQLGNLKMHVSASSGPETFPSSVLSPQRPLGGPESLRYLHTSNPFMHSAYGYPAQHFPAVPVLPLIHAEKDQSQLVMAGYDYSPDSSRLASAPKKLPESPSRSLTMTPQEKIEKLRRRQQVQAMLAILKQQEELVHLGTCTDNSFNHNYSQENQGDLLPSKAEVEENPVKLPSQELNLLGEQDDLTRMSMLNDECSLVETIFNQLKDVVGKLEIKTRLCIRDSLFRLARSAMQRQSVCDTSSTNKNSKDKDGGVDELNSKERSTCLSDTETDTNPIDRSVAHLLFHRPTETCSRPARDGISESTNYSNPEKFPVISKIVGCLNPPTRCLSKTSIGEQGNPCQDCQPQPSCTSADPQNEIDLLNNP